MNISNDSILLIFFIVFTSGTPTLRHEWTRHVGIKIEIGFGIGFKNVGSESGNFFFFEKLLVFGCISLKNAILFQIPTLTGNLSRPDPDPTSPFTVVRARHLQSSGHAIYSRPGKPFTVIRARHLQSELGQNRVPQ